MTVGALIFAHNNTGLDYTKLAVFAASRVRQYLDIPVSIVTDNAKWLESNYANHPFDKVIEIPTEKSLGKIYYDGALSHRTLEWKNLSRNQAFDLTPYDKTLVLDSDYIVSSSNLKLALERDVPFQIFKESFDLCHWRPTTEFSRINLYSIPFYWATVFIFEKNFLTQAFFDLVSYIKANWLYFRVLYSIEMPNFRNDFAFSIAIHIMNGKMDGDFAIEIPGKMSFIKDKDILLDISGSKMKFLVEKEKHVGEYIAVKTDGIDVHVMNKLSLTRCIDGESSV